VNLTEDSSLEEFQTYLHGLYPIVQLCPNSPCRAADAAVEATGVAAAALVVMPAADEDEEEREEASEVPVDELPFRESAADPQPAEPGAAAAPAPRADPAWAGALQTEAPVKQVDGPSQVARVGVRKTFAGSKVETNSELGLSVGSRRVDVAPTRWNPSLEPPPLPNSSGCFVWLPSGCRKQHFRARVHWKRDEWGEANRHSGDSRSACDARKMEFDTWCWVTDAVMLHVPADV